MMLSVRTLLLGAALLTALALPAGPAAARMADEALFANAPALSDRALDQLRGGLRIGGFSFNFGLTVRSTIRDSLALVTQLTMGDRPGQWEHVRTQAWSAPVDTGPDTNTGQTITDGTVTGDTVTGGAGPQVPPAGNTPNTPASNNTPNTPPPHNPAPPPVTPPPAQVTHQDGGLQVAVGDPQGAQIIHQVTQSHLTALITNQLDGQQIESIAELNITIENFRQTIGDLMPAIRARHLTRNLGLP